MKTRTFISAAVTALFVASVTSPVAAQTDATRPAAGTSGQATGAKLAGDDRQFVERAASGGMTEVEMGQLAQDKASNDQVKQYAARMVRDHKMANEELKQLAKKKGVAIPAGHDKSHNGQKHKLNKVAGAEFDRQYMAHMVSDHLKTVAEFVKAAESAKDDEVKAFASKTLPTLQEHLKLAQSINDSVKSASR